MVSEKQLKSDFQYLTFLDESGYLPVAYNAEDLLCKSIMNTLARLGKSYYIALLQNMRSLDGLSENELLTNYDLFEKSLYSILGKTGQPILRSVKREMLTNLVMTDPSITIKDILNSRLGVKGIMNEMKELETLEFISKIRAHEHIALLYQNELSKNKILSKFFDPHTTGRVSKGMLLLKKPDNDFCDFRCTNILYEELLSQDNRTKHGITKILSDWIAKLHSSNRSEKEQFEEGEENTIQTTRIAEEDATWWLRNGFDHQIISIEKLLDNDTQENDISVLCAFDRSKISNIDDDKNSIIKTTIAVHEYVILDEPFRVYKSKRSEM
jgi:hypothetical protein